MAKPPQRRQTPRNDWEPVIGDNEVAYLLRRIAQATWRASNDLANCPEAAKLADIFRSDRPLDPGDRDMLADYLEGRLFRAPGDRGPAHKQLNEAVRKTRAYAKANDVSLDKAAEVVAPDYGLEPDTVINKLRRARPRRR